MFANVELAATTWNAQFKYLAGGGSGADGFVFMFYKDEAIYGQPGAAGGGGALGFQFGGCGNGIPGYGIEFDNFQNGECGEPSANHIALIKDNIANHLAYTDDSRTEDNTWHDALIQFDNGRVTASVDGEVVLEYVIPSPDYTYSGIGFSAATGLYTNDHIIDDFVLTLGTADTIPPAAITNLSASSGVGAGQVTLTWTAPGDDGNTGTATAYTVRYATSAIATEFGWIMATDVVGEPVPQPAGTSQSKAVTDLAPGQTYYFAIKTQDEAGNTSSLSNSPGLLAPVGFRPNPDGYGFANPGASSPRPNCEEFKGIFSGEPIVCKNNRLQGNRYNKLYNEIRSFFSQGICVGMASTSLDYFKGGLTKPKPVTTFNLSLDDAWPNIALYHGRALSKAFHNKTYDEWQRWKPGTTSGMVDDVYQRLKAALGSQDPVTILFWPKPDSPKETGHAVTPYRIDEADPQRPKVYLYENFAPGDNTKSIQFDFSAVPHSFSYGGWNSTNGALVLAPLSIWHSAEANIPYDGQTVVKSGGGELVITNDDGQAIGYTGGVLTATIPGAMPLFPWYSPDSPEPSDRSYILPTGNYTASISNAAEPFTYTMWTTNSLVQVSTAPSSLQMQSATDISGTDQIAVDSTGSKATLLTNGNLTRRYDFQLTRNRASTSKEYEVTKASLGPGASFTVGIGASDDLHLQNDAGQTTYDLNLRMVMTDTIVGFHYPTITLSATDIHTITVSNWQQLNTVTLQIDHGGDGTIDESQVLENQLVRVYLPTVFRDY